MSSAPTKVIIVGCGVAGPVLALFLKSKGYQPVIYERIVQDSDGGISLMLQSNGLKVLNLIPGLLAKLPGHVEDRMAFYSTVPGDEGLLGEYTTEKLMEPSQVAEEPISSIGLGVRRHDFLHLLAETAINAGVEIHWEHKVVDIQQHADSVQVFFENGRSDTASFVVGCDGIHSVTRTSLFGKEKATFTGLTQIGGITLCPKSFDPTHSHMVQYFGLEGHIMSYRIGPNLYSWAVTRRESEEKETWHAVDDSMLKSLKEIPASQWGFGAGELIKNSLKLTKYGLYDRPQLATWYKGRVVLLGDAAHPTSPHLGQGANQAFEDIYHLVRVLIKFNPSAQNPSTETLSNAFKEYESVRIPRTSVLVKGAREMGEKTRVVSGMEACIARNNKIRDDMEATRSSGKLSLRYSEARIGPFEGQSEI
ncbi:hypothetical protein GYMLUDRAFT_34848 [Collybiopsis luxurians FD-317 M1]|nr:hypothetical protein GYMLUDRAFT_34848 [Collybiopsis luxurians FD-317 M1]